MIRAPQAIPPKSASIIVGLWLTALCLNAQPSEDQLYFKHYSVEDGLSQNTVNTILKVKDASIWIGTDDGLNHFNGHEFVSYRNKINDPTSLSHNNVLSIDSDSLQRLWIGTASGLARYNPQSDNFTIFRDSSNSNYFADLLMDQKRNRIWLASEETGLKYFDLQLERVIHFKHPGLGHAVISALTFDRNGVLLVGTLNQGVYRVDPDANEVTSLFPQSQLSAEENTVHALLLNGETLWIATEGGLHEYNLDTNKKNIHTVATHSLKSDLVWSLALDQDNKLWIGTDGGGLTILDQKNKQFETHTYSQDNPQSLSGNTLRAIYIDDEGSSWLGTYNNGVNYFNQASKNFHNYGRSKPISAFEETPDETLLIATDGDGLLRFNKADGALIPVPGIQCKKILSLHRDRNGGLWMGTFQEGLHYKKDNVYKVYKHSNTDSTSLLDDTIWAITEDGNNIWLGTENGLCRFDKNTGKFEAFLRHNDYKFSFYSSLVHSLLVDSKGRIWMGASSCIGYFNPVNHQYHQYPYQAGVLNCVSNSIVVSLLELDGFIWAGTFGGGLNRINPETNEVAIFDEEKGLPNNTVFSLEKDRQGNIWMSTNKGIVKFDYTHNKFSVYGSEVGVLNKTFYVGSSHRTIKNEMVFGGNNGFNVFNPEEVIDYNRRMVASITGVLDDSHITKPKPLTVNGAGELILEYDDSRFLGFTLSAYHYLAPEDEIYSYRLIGLENTWRNVGKQRNLILTNLSPGSYTLEIKVGVNNQWSQNITRLPIKILTPWWMSLYFKIGLGLLFIVAIMVYMKARVSVFRNREINLERLVLEKTKEIQSQSDELVVQNEELQSQNEQIFQQAEIIRLGQEKLSSINNTLEDTVEKRTSQLKEAYRELDIFFYRASHDFRRPLTTFMGLAEVAKLTVKESNALELFNKVNDTARNLDKMIRKLQSVSEVSSSETVYQDVFPEEEIRDVSYVFREEITAKGIDFQYSVAVSRNVRSQRGLLRIILLNIVENAIQFATPLNPFVNIRVFDKDNLLYIEVSDNGEGIPTELQKRVFEMYFKASEKQTGNGLGLYIVKKSLEKLRGNIQLTSQRKVGTTIVIEIPMDEEE